jgi:hypothetical protein
VFAAPELILTPDSPATLALLRETLDTLKAGTGYSSSRCWTRKLLSWNASRKMATHLP